MFWATWIFWRDLFVPNSWRDLSLKCLGRSQPPTCSWIGCLQYSHGGAWKGKFMVHKWKDWVNDVVWPPISPKHRKIPQSISSNYIKYHEWTSLKASFDIFCRFFFGGWGGDFLDGNTQQTLKASCQQPPLVLAFFHEMHVRSSCLSAVNSSTRMKWMERWGKDRKGWNGNIGKYIAVYQKIRI